MLAATRALLRQQIEQATRQDGTVDPDRLTDLLVETWACTAQALDQQAAQFRAVLDNMAQGVCLFDREQKLVTCNRRYAELYGLDPAEMRPGMAVRDILEKRCEHGSMPVDRDEYRQAREKVIGAGLSDDSIVELGDGTVIAIRHEALSDGGWVATHEDITARRRAERQLAYMANYDGLTGLPNQAMLDGFVERALAQFAPHQPCTLLLLNVDRFRIQNEVMSRPATDDLICQVADRLRQLTPVASCLARIDSDEFAIVQTRADQPAGGTQLAERLLGGFGRPFLVDGQEVTLGLSVGIAVADSRAVEAESLFKRARVALQQAKEAGRGAFRLFQPEMDEASQARRQLARDLREAVAAKAFELHYQPQVNLRTRRITAFEALLRWNHPQRGAVAPADFVPLAEEIGLIGTIGSWALQQACLEAVGWSDGIGVAVNVSAVQLGEGALPGIVAAALETSGLPPSRLELEITETVLMESNEVTLASLRDLRSAGVRIAIDDFGVGYSSLSYLTSYPFDKIKIDRSFVSGPGQLQDRRAIVRAVVGLCASLGMTCTAEGVETEEQLAMLASENCREAQGYLFGRPLPAAGIDDLLRRMTRLDGASISIRPAAMARVSFFQIAETVNDIIIVTTPGLEPPGPLIVYVNPAFTRLTGYSAADALGKSPRMLQGPGTSRAALDAIRAALRAGLPVHEKLLNFTKRGAPYWIDLRIAALRDPDGTITHYASVQRDVTLDKRRLDELEFVADRDTLTGIPNRRALLRVIDAEIQSARTLGATTPGGRGPCLAFIDVDNFKQINDVLGHSAGDAVLFGMADRLAENVRRTDTVGRLGGEEFAVCMPAVTLREAKALAERLRGAVAAAPFQALTGTVSVTVSIGVAAFVEGDTLNRIMARADAAMYAAKREGRDRVTTMAELT